MINHRGPDYCGTYSEPKLFLGHNRLSILDLTAAGNQPYRDGEAQLVFNGEIYNWKQLRSQYLSDAQLHSHSDTEVLFLLLRKLGTACLGLLDGMFAFAYRCAATHKMILGRDISGIKPLYFIADALSFEFSSEIKNINYVPDLNRLKEYLVFGRIGEDFLPYSNVKEVLPGSYVELDTNTGLWGQHTYRDIESLISSNVYRELAGATNVVDRLDQMLIRSVAMHEQSDAPIGFLCSGGLDSSLITAIAAKSHPDISLYHADFEGEGRELEYAEQVARHVGAPLYTTKISRSDFWRTFAEVTYSLDLPVQHPHCLSLSMISKRVQDDGLKVLLCGEGADELFAGYWFYSSYSRAMLSSSSTWNEPRRGLKKFLQKAWSRLQVDPDSYWFFSDFDANFKKHAHVAMGDAWSLSDPLQALGLVGQDFKAWSRWQQAIRAFEWLQDSHEASVLSFQLFYMRYHLQPLLHRLDRMLMMRSIEGRVPFLENELIQFALNLQLKHKINGISSKYVLKQVASRYLPDNIVNRKKIGFTVPWNAYLSGFPKILENGFVSEWTGLNKKDLQAWCDLSPTHIYRLISVEVWGRIFIYHVPWSDINLAD